MAQILVLLSLTLLANSISLPFWGSCPQIKLQENFQLQKYLGLWYQQIRDIGAPFEYGDCNSQELTYNEGDKYVKVYNSGIVDGKLSDIYGEVYCDDNSASCHVSFGGPFGNYGVYKTDYETYTQIYSCTNILFFFRYEYFWLMTRDPNLPQDQVQSLLTQFLTDVSISDSRVRNTDQTNCNRG